MSTHQSPTSQGKIVASSTRLAYCEFPQRIDEGAVLTYLDDGKTISCKVTYVQSSPRGHYLGHVAILDVVHKPPAPGTLLHAPAGGGPKPQGVLLSVSRDQFNNDVPLRLNHLFRNVLLAGKTSSGKTHLAIAIAEELLKLKVPHLIVDTQSEFTGLEKKGAFLLDGDNRAQIWDALRERNTVVVPLLGETPERKCHILQTLAEELLAKKEKAEAKKQPFPPVIVTVDEAEIYAPSIGEGVVSTEALHALEDLVKRGVKLGIGTIVISQRPPMLNSEVRSQCNSAALFLLDDPGSLKQIRLLNITRFELEMVRRLRPLQCVLVGAAVTRPTLVEVRAITTERPKNVDFEGMLGLQPATVWNPASIVEVGRNGGHR